MNSYAQQRFRDKATSIGQTCFYAAYAISSEKESVADVIVELQRARNDLTDLIKGLHEAARG